ncbi:MAG: S24/S26 family peptidase [Flavobacteriales bacterium]|nr:S24/S26 family peptidase [Flavobacteriales bacterium]
MQAADPTKIAEKQLLREARLSMLRNGHQIRVTLDGYSMFPLLLPNDVAIVKPLHDALPQLGDIALVELPEKWIAHRIVQVKSKDGYRLAVSQGDSLTRPDQVLTKEMISGVIQEVYRDGKEVDLCSGWRGMVGRSMVVLRPLPQFACRFLLKLKRSVQKLFPKS